MSGIPFDFTILGFLELLIVAALGSLFRLVWS